MTYNVKADSGVYDVDLILSVEPDVTDSHDDDEEYKSFTVMAFSMHVNNNAINRIIVDRYTVTTKAEQLLFLCWDLVAS